MLTATSTTPIVTVDLDVSQEYLVKPGDAVSIVLPDGTSTVGGHIETVGNVASLPGRWRHRHRHRRHQRLQLGRPVALLVERAAAAPPRR